MNEPPSAPRDQDMPASPSGGKADDARLEELYRDYAGRLRRYVRRLVADRGLSEALVDTEGVVQESFLRLLGTSEPVLNPAAWLFVVARNQVGRAAASQHRASTGDPADHLATGTAGWSSLTPRPRMEDLLAARAVVDAIAELSGNQRIATYLRHVQGWSQAEIAEYLDCATSTAGVHIHRGAWRIRRDIDWTSALLPAAILAQLRKAAKHGRRLVTWKAHAGSGIQSTAASAPTTMASGTTLAADAITGSTPAGNPGIFAAIAGHLVSRKAAVSALIILGIAGGTSVSQHAFTTAPRENAGPGIPGNPSSNSASRKPPLTVSATVQFPLDSAVVPAQAHRSLSALAAEARSGHWSLRIVGYASPDGVSRTRNDALSLERALAVRALLIKLGLPPDQISSVTWKGTAGIPPQACDRDGHVDEIICAQYRKVVIVAVKLKTRII